MTTLKLIVRVSVLIFLLPLCQTRHFHFDDKFLQESKMSQPSHNSTQFYSQQTPALMPRLRMETRKHRLRRSIGSVKLQGYLTQKLEQDQAIVPPTFVALVFIDVIAAIFTFNAIAALLFVANHY